mgnify:FL=1
MDSAAKQTPGFSIQLPEDLEPIHSNVARISHTPSDFVLDFSRILPGQPIGKVLARLVMSPVAVKLLSRALAENIARYETVFGEINLPQGEAGLVNDLFRRPHPPEGTE